MLRENECQLRVLYLTKQLFKIEGKIKTFFKPIIPQKVYHQPIITKVLWKVYAGRKETEPRRKTEMLKKLVKSIHINLNNYWLDKTIIMMNNLEVKK